MLRSGTTHTQKPLKNWPRWANQRAMRMAKHTTAQHEKTSVFLVAYAGFKVQKHGLIILMGSPTIISELDNNI